MLIDTHSHLNFNAYKDDLDEVMKRTLDNDIRVINVGSKYETSKRAVEIAEKYQGTYAAIGLHPIYASDAVKIKTDPEEGDFLAKTEIFDKEKYKRIALSDSRRVVAIGEIGLDYYYRPKTKSKLEIFKQKQKEVFLKQLELARELNLSVIVHCRMAHNDLIE
jgi:TatD DNase family protein